MQRSPWRRNSSRGSGGFAALSCANGECAKGLVERVRDSADRRSVRIRLTEHGKDLADQAMDAHLRDYERILSVLTPEECEQIASGLRKVLEAQGDTALS
ncbi:MarR family winged helix-turn-helix transcriptional regulator [Streptomyces sp. NPDC059850]|uniref:MarR family winged helix-turn-helix transcriptional regulator n=1 Tax=Streptomyces sp. NPDC059850 TaxID=3346970 RepID=UPI0036611AD9